jgi:hypothetical protein
MTRWAASQPNLRKKCVVNVGMPGARPSHEFFLSLRYRLQSFEVRTYLLGRDEMIIVILWRACFLTADSLSNQWRDAACMTISRLYPGSNEPYVQREIILE